MSKPSSPPSDKPAFRKRRLFPRSLEETVKAATQPLMDKQGKIYGALLRDWAQIVGAERAAYTRPQKLQFPPTQTSGAILHLAVRPAMAPELAYATEQMLERCARYFGYRAIDRIVLHPTHGMFDPPADAAPALPAADTKNTVAPMLTHGMPEEMRAVLERMAQHVTSASDKKDEAR